MAAALGSLVVSLGLDAAEFTKGLSKSEAQARKFGEALGTGIKNATLLATAALASLGAAAVGAFGVFDQLAKSAGDFQDLAEKTGASAEALASFGVAAATGGTSVESIAAASQKLTKALTGVDDESKAAGAALAAIGLNIKDFKALDPAAQIEAVSKALAGFEEGAGKTAVAMALFGKTGAEILPFLKALEEQGGRQIILTAEQIRQADEYADRQAAAKAQLQQYAQALATEALPALTALTDALTEAAKELLGVDEAGKKLVNGGHVAAFAEQAALFIAGVIDQARNAADVVLYLGKTFGAAGAVVAAVARGEFGQIKSIIADARADGAKLFNNDFSGRVAAQFAKIRASAKLAAQEVRGFNPGGNKINFDGAEKAGAKGGKTAKERQSEADKYLANLQKQLEKTQELTVVDQLLLDISKGRLGIVSDVARTELLGIAQQIDAAKALEKAQKESNDRLVESNKQVQASREALIKQGQSLTESLRTPLEVLQAAQAEANKLLDAGVISADTFRRAMIAASEGYQKAFEEANKQAGEFDMFAKKAAENIQDAIGSGLTDILNGNFKDIGKNFTQMINRMVSEAVAADLTRSLLGDLVKGGTGSGLFGDIFKSFAGALGGASSGGARGNNPSAFSSGGGGGGSNFFSSLIASLFSGGFATGGYIPPGQWGMTGERGPEPIFGGKTGVTVRPNGAGGGTTVINYQSSPGESRATAGQNGAVLARALQMNARRNG